MSNFSSRCIFSFSYHDKFTFFFLKNQMYLCDMQKLSCYSNVKDSIQPFVYRRSIEVVYTVLSFTSKFRIPVDNLI